nr:guanosine nucleotide diphosphate dissociation inhibitor At5g09550 [Ipomoea batatas]
MGASKEYNVDMIPKFMMANGALVRVLIHTKVTKYLNFKAVDGSFVYNKGKLYAESLARFQAGSPYIYPMYGLGELPQGFARLSAVYGGTYMLNKPECKVEFDESGKAYGVTSEGETAKCKKVVCDPSYLTDKGKYIAFVLTEAETDNPEAELKPGVDLLGPVDEIFYETYDRYVPINDSAADNCFISASYDASTHFESTVQDVLAMYTKITGKAVDLSVDLSAASAGGEDEDQ